MKAVKKLVAILLAACMTLTLTSCGNTTWIAKDNNGFTVPVGAYTYYVYYTYTMLLSQGVITAGADLEKTEVSDGKNAQDFINELALDNVKYLIELEHRFNEAGLTITDEQKAALELETDSDGTIAGTQYAANEEFFTKNGVAKSSVVLASLDGGLAGLKEELLYEHQYGENGVTPITMDEIKQYYADNYVYMSYISEPIASVGGSSSEVDAEIQAKVKAEYDGYKKACESGSKDFEAIVAEYAEKGDTYFGVSKNSYSKSSGSELLTAVAEIGEGEYLYKEIGSRAYLIHRLKASESKYLENEDNVYNIRQSMKMTEFQNEILEAAKADTSITINESARKKFAVQKLKFN